MCHLCRSGSRDTPWIIMQPLTVEEPPRQKVVRPTNQLRNSFWRFIRHLTRERHLFFFFLSWLPCLCRSVLIWSASSSRRASFNFSWQRLFKWGNASSVFNLALLPTEHDKSAQRKAFKSAAVHSRSFHFIVMHQGFFFSLLLTSLSFFISAAPTPTSHNTQFKKKIMLKRVFEFRKVRGNWLKVIGSMNDFTEHGNITRVKVNQEIAPLV